MKTGRLSFPTLSQLPDDAQLLLAISAASTRLSEKIAVIDLSRLPISSYSRGYLKQILQQLQRRLEVYSFLLAWALTPHKGRALEDLTLVELGAGTGLLCALAREAGVGRIIYSEIYPTSVSDAKILLQHLNLSNFTFVEGEVTDVNKHLTRLSIHCDVVVSHDVLEHVYRPKSHLTDISLLPGPKMSVFLMTSANGRNPIIRRTLIRRHRELENTTRNWDPDHKERDSLESYYEIRRKIIASLAPQLDIKETCNLARATRGMRRDDIEVAVKNYLDSNRALPVPSHPTNTCDPMTGNWGEHILDTACLVNSLKAEGFHAGIRPGFYGHRKMPIGRIICLMLNLLVRLLPADVGLYLAPTYSIFGIRSSQIQAD